MDLSLDQVWSALQYVSPDEPRNEWAKMGMALKAEFGQSGFDLFDTWSQGSDKYKPRDCRSAWRSFKVGGGIGIGSLIKKAKDAGWRMVVEERDAATQAAYLADLAARRAKAKQDLAEEEAWRNRMAEVVAQASDALIAYVFSLSGSAECPYLSRKEVGAFGVYVVPSSVVVVIDDACESYKIISGEKDIKSFFNDYADAGKPDCVSVRNIKRGSLLVPLSADGRLWSVQIIFPTGTKSFFRHGRKSGCSHVLNGNDGIVCVAEGYATAASIFMATGYTTVVAVDAGNLPVVVPRVRARYPSSELLICADDDCNTDGNPGLSYALDAARVSGAGVVLPVLGEAAA